MSGDTARLVVTCPRGVSGFLAEEVRSLGLAVDAVEPSAVTTSGRWTDALRLNLEVRTGHRVLLAFGAFDAASGDDLYRGCLALPWEDWLAPDGYFTVGGDVRTGSIRDARYAFLRCKDAVADRMRARTGRRPDSGSEPRGAAVFLRWVESRVEVLLDTSGAPLSRRGYRLRPMEAPLQETLAAAIVRATGWRGGGRPFVNPMCGSGTLAIEAAWIAADRAPGLLREEFAFRSLRPFDAAEWEALRAAARGRARPLAAGGVVASDLRPAAVEAARENAARAGVAGAIAFQVCDFSTTRAPAGGVVVMNPEYGVRLGRAADLERTYGRIGGYLRRAAAGGCGYVLTGNRRLAARVGLRPSRTWDLFNGPIACTLAEYRVAANREGRRRGGRTPPPRSA